MRDRLVDLTRTSTLVVDHRLGAGVATRGLVDGPGAGGRQGLVDTRVTTTGRVGPRLGAAWARASPTGRGSPVTGSPSS